MVTTSQPAETAPEAFVVVLNDQDQHALWRAGLDVPPGWRCASAAMARSECLAAIDGGWPDIAPASVRAAAAGRRADGERFVHEAFAEQAVRRPDATAVIAGRTRVSYRELDSSANRLAHYLGEVGAGPEAMIGVYMERGVDVIRAILAIMKAGAGYLPLDPSLPPERLSAICAQVRPAAVIAARPDMFPGIGTRPLPLATSPPNWRAGRPRRPPSACALTTSATPSTRRGPPAIPSRSPSATAAWPASSESWRGSTRSRTTTGWRRWRPWPLTPPLSRYSLR